MTRWAHTRSGKTLEMEHQENAAGVRQALAYLELAGELITQSPAAAAAFGAQLESAIVLLESAPAIGPGDVDELRVRVNRLQSLFHQARSFYEGWSALAGLCELDMRQGSISING
jgi:hypothetical protein